MISRATLLLLITIVAWLAMRRSSAATRHAILIVGLGASLFAAAPLPSFHLPAKKVYAASHVITAPRVRNVVALWERGSVAPRRSLVSIWMIGGVLVALRVALAWIAALRLRALAARNGKTFHWLGYRVVSSDVIAAPATVGRTILVPIEWSEAMLMHESAHIRRGDPFTRLVAQIACAIYWFHPLAWIAARLAMLEQERACDDEVIAGGVEPADYATLLLNVARTRTGGAALAMTGSELESRIRSIVDPRRRRGRAGWWAVATAAALSVAALGAPMGNLLYDDPISEELPDVTVHVGDISTSPERAVIDVFLQYSRKPKTWYGDLVAQRSRWALSRMRNGVIVAPLRESLDDADWRVRAYAAWSLGAAHDTGAVPRLIALLDDPVWRMRAMAAAALHEIGDPRAEAAMRRAARDERWQVNMEARAFLEELKN
jgi:beta-lactamase regulating signal transducer with metallopeptidase domain